MFQHISDYHTRAVIYYLFHYNFFTMASEAINQMGHLYHILHIVL